MQQAAAGAAVLYNAASPPYRRWVTDWPPLAASVLAAAEKSGAVLVSVANLYGYGPTDQPMVETDPLRATSRKGHVRAQIWNEALAAHQSGRVRATELRSSDYFGPRVLMSQLGERIVPRVLAGKPVSVFGSIDAPHSWTYIDDVCRTLIVLGRTERAWGAAWHTPTNPPLSQRQIVTALSTAAGLPAAKVRTLPPLALKALGIFIPDIRELAEIRYQFDDPFVVDSSNTQSTFHLTPTPMDEALAATIAWYRARTTTTKDDDDREHNHVS
jgi:nucleoside-diphosphate-sugar epimerase